ncbi:MAG TPA: hypothetical protein VJ840_04610 [Gemmatimonadaceae bacterium]|nr:hypothetical protein [Gemmatimonadaceae bacterium]
MSFSARTGLQIAAPVISVVVLLSCTPPSGARLTPTRSFRSFSERQIADVSPVTAYDAVLRLRPIALNPAGGKAFAPTVYLNGLRMGGVDQLMQIPAMDLTSIEFLSPIEAAARFGPMYGYGGGAILLTMRVGRR